MADGVGFAVGVAVGVTVGLAVGDAVGVGLTVGLAVGVGLEVGVGLALGAGPFTETIVETTGATGPRFPKTSLMVFGLIVSCTWVPAAQPSTWNVMPKVLISELAIWQSVPETTTS